MKLQPYPEYKSSGVRLLDEIPCNWGITKLKRVTSIRGRIGFRGYTKDDLVGPGEGAVTIGGKHIDKRNRLDLSDAEYISWAKYYESPEICLKGGDIVIVQRGSLGKVAIIPSDIGPATINPSMILLTNINDGIGYLYYLLTSLFIQHQINMDSSATAVPMISQEQLGSFVITVPSFQEQLSISGYLDHKIRYIDDLIIKKEHQIELLQEKRAALISHVVSKGLNPNAKMKDSGIEWLGEIPEHWEAKRLKFLVSEPLKYGANEAAELDDPSLPRYIRITDVDENGQLREETFKSIPEEVAKPYLLKDGDVLLARSGATVGKSFYYDPSWGRAAYAGYLIRARFNSTKMIPRFINYFTNSQQYWQWLNSSFIQATIQNVSAEKYANLIIPVPSFEEQKQIVAYLDIMWKQLGDLADKIKKSILCLMEYRTALISAAVTGKIDVRQEVD